MPKGWSDHPDKVTAEKQPTPIVAAPVQAKQPPAHNIDLDADGWPFDPAMHAATKTRTTADLWRMKVGVKRPAPKEGFPKTSPNLDL